MTPNSELPTPHADWGLFFDIDGTLLEIAPTPDGVIVGKKVLAVLQALHEATGGALALVSGRALDRIDQLFSPLRLPAAGLHGLEMRFGSGEVRRPPPPTEGFGRMQTALGDFVSAHPGLVFEDKGPALALHYRLVPELESHARAQVEELIGTWGEGYSLLAGKMVFEIKPAHTDKGQVIEAFMAREPFAGRCPVYVGDDVTDEDAFAVVNRLGGHTIHVGLAAATRARYRVRDVGHLLDWLAVVARHLGSRTS